MEQNLEDLYYVIHHLKGITDTFYNEISNLNQEVETLKGKIQVKNDTIEHLQSANSVYQQNANNAKASSDTKIKQLNEQLKQLKQSEKSKGDLVERYQTNITNLQEENSRLERTQTRLQTELENLRSENAQLKEQIQKDNARNNLSKANSDTSDNLDDFRAGQTNLKHSFQKEISDNNDISENKGETGADTDTPFCRSEESQKGQKKQEGQGEESQGEKESEKEKEQRKTTEENVGSPTWDWEEKVKFQGEE